MLGEWNEICLICRHINMEVYESMDFVSPKTRRNWWQGKVRSCKKLSHQKALAERFGLTLTDLHHGAVHCIRRLAQVHSLSVEPLFHLVGRDANGQAYVQSSPRPGDGGGDGADKGRSDTPGILVSTLTRYGKYNIQALARRLAGYYLVHSLAPGGPEPTVATGLMQVGQPRASLFIPVRYMPPTDAGRRGWSYCGGLAATEQQLGFIFEAIDGDLDIFFIVAAKPIAKMYRYIHAVNSFFNLENYSRPGACRSVLERVAVSNGQPVAESDLIQRVGFSPLRRDRWEKDELVALLDNGLDPSSNCLMAYPLSWIPAHTDR